jgi:hypothetical protein
MGIASSWSVRGAIGLPVIELTLALTLVLIPASPLPAITAVVVLGGFTVFLVATIRRAVPCPCFGAVRTAGAGSGPAAIARNGVLLAIGVVGTGEVDGARAGATLFFVAIVGAIAGVAATR